MLPVREICFKDSSPAAVEAVIRYIYLGQKPILEPLCGYTVKDLMSLASYLEIECLQDYCVDLVLGKNYSTNRVTFNSHSITADGSRSQPRIDLAKSLVEYENHKVFQRGAHQRQNQVGAEIILQVLFTWGHRFAKIRHGIIQALINDYGYEFRGGNMVALERFKDHEGFDDILCEMMEMMRQIK
ncbi:hypothetical protein BGZ76_008173 [Entomortierella beljakovae]|nr:hypothetical protein BGZ76_008173 [Entomortierella beljakovae]